MSDMREEKGGAPARALHDAPLEGRNQVRIAGDIAVRRLDLTDESVLDGLMRDIQREHAAGNILSGVNYKGKHPARWWGTIYPLALEPVVLGAFINEKLGGWVTSMRTFTDQSRVQLGLVVREGWRDKGLGTALVRHVLLHKATFHGDTISGVIFTTLASNTRMRAVARKVNAREADASTWDPAERGEVLFII